MFRHFVLIFLLTLSANAGPTKVSRPTTLHLTLRKAIELALAKNFSLEVERFNPQIARENVTRELGRFDPVFDISAQHGQDVLGSEFTQFSTPGAPLVPANPSSTFRELSQFFVPRTSPGTTSGFQHLDRRSIELTNDFEVGLSGITSWGTQYDLRLSTRNLDPLNGVGERYISDASFGIVQPLLRGFGPDANLSRLRIARNNVLVSEWELRQRIMDTVTNTIGAYNDLHLSIENLKVARGFRDLALQTVNDNTKRVEIGVMSPLNITTARAEAARREEAVIVAARQIKDNENTLKQLITRDLESLLDIRLEIEPPTQPRFIANVTAGIAEALQFRPDYRQAIIEIENRHITLSFTKNAALPRFDLSASLHLLGIDNDLGTSFNRLTRRDQSAWTVGAIFSVPIPNREGRASVASAKLEAARALVNLQRLEQDIVVFVDNASGAVVTARERIRSTGEARVLARESLDAGEERLRAGTGTTFEVLELQRNLAEAEAAELRAYSDFNKAVAGYQREIGVTLREHRILIDPPK